MTPRQRELVTDAARRYLHDLMEQAVKYERLGMPLIADATLREHFNPLKDALDVFEAPARDPVDRMYEAATDHEVDVLDQVRRRAGLIWECYGTAKRPCRWTNVEGETSCEQCGAPAGSTSP
jgi:hypothetical protein